MRSHGFGVHIEPDRQQDTLPGRELPVRQGVELCTRPTSGEERGAYHDNSEARAAQSLFDRLDETRPWLELGFVVPDTQILLFESSDQRTHELRFVLRGMGNENVEIEVGHRDILAAVSEAPFPGLLGLLATLRHVAGPGGLALPT